MGYYFENHQSLHAAIAGNTLSTDGIQRALDTIVRRYVGHNPQHPMTYRAYSRRGILRVKDYRYYADFAKVFPEARDEQYVYAWSKYWADTPIELKFDVSCFGPMTVFLNGNVVFKSTIFTERYSDQRHSVMLPMQHGWNHVVIRFKKTRAGFGGVFGTWLGKHPYYFLMPTADREGQEGWIFSEPLDQELPILPGATTFGHGAEEEVKWRPEIAWPAKQLKLGQLERIFGKVSGAATVAWTTAFLPHEGAAQYRLKGSHEGSISIYIDNDEVYRATGAGKINTTITSRFGRRHLMIKSQCPPAKTRGSWGFDVVLFEPDGSTVIPFSSCCAIQGTRDPWLFIGPFDDAAVPTLEELRDLNRVFTAQHGDTYWRLDMPDGWLRPYNENALFGRWNYPLGVTLYGLLHSAKAIGSTEIQEYIVNHMLSCCSTFKYALWDKEQYGGATAMHTLLSSIDSLDDCGSFGSVMLEVAKYFPIDGFREIADYVADYISNKQARLENGTFYRKILMHIFHESTMWADDLYMSVPFLCRYSQLTGETKYLDDAARQFVGFREKLYMPQHKVMSHIYDFRRDMATGVPWGRGNGWTIFSLSELLEVLPETHPLRPELLAFFRDLCAGYLALQDDQGMWHQVLTHVDSYPETSCTSMFIYAFARGVRFGWLKEGEPFVRAALKAWDALNRISIDRGGNVHGVCRGSEFSFTPEYYKKDLLWNLNDTHGIGIVLLAGVEMLRLIDHLQSDKIPESVRRSSPAGQLAINAQRGLPAPRDLNGEMAIRSDRTRNGSKNPKRRRRV